MKLLNLNKKLFLTIILFVFFTHLLSEDSVDIWKKENLNKNDLGREKFIEKVWEWKNQYVDIIINQLKKLGCSGDWSRNAFTMDKDLSKSVIKVFVELHKKKLIYKAEKLVT